MLIKREGERLGRMRPPATLDPPCIVIRRNKCEKLEPLSDDEDGDDIDGEGEDDEAPRKKKGKRSASVFESDEGDEDE